MLPVAKATLLDPCVILYSVIAEPPSSMGAVQSTFTEWWPIVMSVKSVGAPGRAVTSAVAALVSVSE